MSSPDRDFDAATREINMREQRRRGQERGSDPRRHTQTQPRRRPAWVDHGFHPTDPRSPPETVERRSALGGRASRPQTFRQQASSGPRELQRAASHLDAASSDLRALLDDPIPIMSVPAANDSSNEAEPSRRFKRRKLDTDRLPADYKGFSYGYYGQVVPGKLTMEIVSCDGGSYESDSNRHAAENVLKDDRSVYCTKANRCNLILRHQGATPFCLEELVIKAPPRGYTAPVQEGMVFVSMTSDDLLERTARYQIQYSSPKKSGRDDRTNELPPIASIRHHEDNTVTVQSNRHFPWPQMRGEDEDDWQANIPSEFTVNFANYNVTTECSDDEEDEYEDLDDVATQNNIRYRNLDDVATQNDTRIRNSSQFGASYLYEETSDLTPWDAAIYRRALSESAPRDSPSEITLAEAVEASQIATQEAVKAVGGVLMAAHARFFIEKNKSKCTIRFDPPVSGRFILLKMWSPRRETNMNIDIQSVVARGFAGPRLFPAQQFQ